MNFSARVKIAMFLRSLAIQGSWNYRTMIGGGFAFAMLPALRSIFAGQPEPLEQAIDRHRGLFNSHPYLVGVALGAVARLEAEGADPATIERFKSAVRGSLGGLGDRIIWAGWRPIWAMIALILVASGAPLSVAILTFLIGYNIGHLGLRAWGFRVGYRNGRQVAHELRDASVWHVQGRLADVGALLLGLFLPLAIVTSPAGPLPGWPWLLAALAAAGLGLRFGGAIRTPVIAVLALATLVALVAGLLA